MLGCHSWITHPVDPLTRSYGHVDRNPDVFVRLGAASQVCAKKGVADLRLFINLINLPEQDIMVELDDKVKVYLHGKAMWVDFHALVGQHSARVMLSDGTWTYPLSFSVWNCEL